jgi:hypothetical protein
MQSDIRSLVEEFTNQLELTIRRMALEQVEAALNGGVAVTRRGPGRPRKATTARSSRGGKRDSGAMEEMQTALLAHVKSHPGQRGEQIAEALGTDVGAMRLPMKKLIAARTVRTEGQRRGMTYFPGGAGSGGSGKPRSGGRGAKGGRRARRSVPKKAAAGT